MITSSDEIAKPLDLRLLEGNGFRTKPLEYSFNYLRGLLNSKSDTCWECHNLNNCSSKEHILKCSKVKPIIKELKQKGLL